MVFGRLPFRFLVASFVVWSTQVWISPAAAQSPPYGTINPGDSYYEIGTTNVQVHVEFCSPNSFFDSWGMIYVNGEVAGATSPGSNPGCSDFQLGDVTIPVMPEGQTIVSASVCCDEYGSASVQATYTASQPTPPLIDVTPHNGYHWNPGIAVLASFNTVVSYTTPAYNSLDVPRAVTLAYFSDQAQGRHTIQVDVTNQDRFAPAKFSLLLKRSDNSYVTFTNGSTELFFQGWEPSGVRRLGAQFDDATLTTGAYAYTVVIRGYWLSSVKESTLPLRLLVLNEQGSPYGAGWAVAGIARLKVALGDSLVFWDGAGSIEFWRRTSCDGTGCTFSPPLGSFDKLRFTNSGSRSDPVAAYVRTVTDGTKLTLDDLGRLRYVDDQFGNRVTFSWLDALRVDQITDPAGKIIKFGYDGSNRLSTIRDSVGHRQTTFSVNASNDLVQIQDPAGGKPLQSAVYSLHRLTSRTDRRGAVWSYSYDFAGKLATETSPAVKLFDGSTQNLVTTYGSPESHLLIDPASGQGTSANPAPPKHSFDVTATSQSPSLAQRQMLVDPYGAVTLTFAPVQRAASFTRNNHGQVTDARDTTGHRIYAWDGPRLLLDSNVVTGATVHFEWDTTLNRVTHRYGGASDIRNYYGANSRLDSTKVGTDPTTRFTYDGRGRVLTATDPRGHITQYFRDGTSFLNTDSVKAGSRRTAYGYDSFGRVATAKNPADLVDTTAYDVLNRVKRRAGPLGSFVMYGYEDSLNLTTVTDAKGQSYRADKNRVGWDTATVDPRGSRNRYEYDGAGHVRRWTNRRGQVTAFAHDALGRDTLRSLADGRVTIYRFGPTWKADSSAEGIDTLRWVGDSVYETSVRGGTSYTVLSVFDAKNKIASVELWNGGSGYYELHPYRAAYVLDTAFRVKILRTENPAWCGELLCSEIHEDTLIYNGDGRLTTVKRHGVTNTSDLLRPGHDLAAVSHTNSLWQSAFGVQFDQDALGHTVEKDNGNRDQFERYTYDSLGRVTGVRRYPASPPCAVTDTLSEFGQLCTTGGLVVASDTFTYDVVGNRVEGGVVAETGNRVRFLRGDSLQYDLDGNVTRKWKPDGSFDQLLYWNSIGQLDSVWTNNQGSAQMVRFGYDGLGRRVRKTVGATTTNYLYHGGELVGEYNASTLRHYTWNPVTHVPHSVAISFSGRSYYATDGHGNVAGLVNAAGTVVNALYRYRPFGETDSLTEVVTNRLRFAGSELDQETGLYHMGARYYDPQLGRFLSEDPLGLRGGINQFAYAGNDPVNFGDPTGMKCTAHEDMAAVPRHGDSDDAFAVVGTSEAVDLEPSGPDESGDESDCDDLVFETWADFWSFVSWILQWGDAVGIDSYSWDRENGFREIRVYNEMAANPQLEIYGSFRNLPIYVTVSSGKAFLELRDRKTGVEGLWHIYTIDFTADRDPDTNGVWAWYTVSISRAVAETGDRSPFLEGEWRGTANTINGNGVFNQTWRYPKWPGLPF